MIPLKSNDRVFVTGKTGGGKTVFVKQMLWASYQRKVFHDVKLDNEDLLSRGATLVNTTQELFAALQNGVFNILYQPMSTDVEDFNRVCEICYKWGNITLLVDEASFYTSGSMIQQYHKEIMMRGRSRGVGIVNCTQRPKHIHNLLISEAEHFFIFRLTLEDDYLKLKGVVPKDLHESMTTLKEYQFVYTGVFNKGFVHAPLNYKG